MNYNIKISYLLVLILGILYGVSCGDRQKDVRPPNLDSIAKNINETSEILRRIQAQLSDTSGFVKSNETQIFENQLISSITSFYGDFNVRSIQNINDLPEPVRPLTRSICAIIPKRFLIQRPGGFMLKSTFLRDYVPKNFQKKICSGQSFLNEINPVFGTGWALKNNLIITANHCCTDQHMADTMLFVFNFLESTNKLIPADRVFRAVNIIPKLREHSTYDFTIIRLDRAVTDPLVNFVETNSTASKGDELFMLGHPLGLCMKYTPGGFIYKPSPDILKTNLDAFYGNSGSPVFNSKTNKIEGILVKGRYDFNLIQQENCVQYAHYDHNYPVFFDGEIVLRINNLILKY